MQRRNAVLIMKRRHCMRDNIDSGTNGSSARLISHAATQLEKALSDKLDQEANELEKLLQETYQEGSHTALQMARLCAIAKLAARQIIAFGWDTTSDVAVNGNKGGEDHLCDLFHNLLTDERNSLLAESRKR